MSQKLNLKGTSNVRKVYLSNELLKRLEDEARRLGVSLGDVVNMALDDMLEGKPQRVSNGNKQKEKHKAECHGTKPETKRGGRGGGAKGNLVFECDEHSSDGMVRAAKAS